MSIKITRTANPKYKSLDLDSVGFGNIFTDHMFRQSWHNGSWHEGSIVPHEALSLSPSCLGLHYGQSVFEGLKAYRGTQDNIVRVFRPWKNGERFKTSCERLCIPSVSIDFFVEAISALVAAETEWVPKSRSNSLYIRPIIFGSEGHLSVRPATSYEFLIITAPVSEYFNQDEPGITLKAEDKFTRAAPGGMGAAKTGGNYAATLKATGDGLISGYDQILWLDSKEHRYIEEAGHMNIFFRIKDKVVTPPLAGTILPGVTRNSILHLLAEWRIEYEERSISVDELMNAERDGTLLEAFGAGTAAVVAPIKNIEFKGNQIIIPNPDDDAICSRLYRELKNIQYGETDDRYGWMLNI